MKMPIAATLALALAFACGGAAAETLCQRLDGEIRAAEQNMAAAIASGVGDNSAPRETNRQLRIANAWSAIRTHMAVMQSAKCPPITRVIGPTPYVTQALECINAGGDACKRENWKSD